MTCPDSSYIHSSPEISSKKATESNNFKYCKEFWNKIYFNIIPKYIQKKQLMFKEFWNWKK